MQSRRDFLKLAAAMVGGAALDQPLQASVARAAAISPEPDSTYLDAEHIVIVMQENRSFDHVFGTLRGVRGFDDPRALKLQNGNLVWLQENHAGETYAPFRLNIRDTRATWMSSLPHSRNSQVGAWNNGGCDQWIEAKRSGIAEFGKVPLTLGYYTRDDLPFHYALADAFTICDQNFSGAMSASFPNRVLFWAGTVRARQNAAAKAYIRNNQIGLGTCSWETFPEWLQQNGVSWKFYQNDVSGFGNLGGKLSMDDRGATSVPDAWLGNMDCNALEYFAQYNLKASRQYLQHLPGRIALLSKEAEDLGENNNIFEYMQLHAALGKEIRELKDEVKTWSGAYRNLSRTAKALHQRAFTINDGDPQYHSVTSLSYDEGTAKREMCAPAGDLLYQFRRDVQNGRLPAVSWLMAPLNFSDHPQAPWYGQWYISEIMDILTENPEIWKKTIFIYTYDENDGYFDHVPPFVASDPKRKQTGLASLELNAGVEYVHRDQEILDGVPAHSACDAPVGLGFRVPMIVASPWSRGGWVNSQVFDHTSVLQFIEHFVGRTRKVSGVYKNISPWRRAVCGDLTSCFRKHSRQKRAALPFLNRDELLISIQEAKYKQLPSDFVKLDAEAIAEVNERPLTSRLLPHQERGVRPSCALPYQLYADSIFNAGTRCVEIDFSASVEAFGSRSQGSGFNVYAYGIKEQIGVNRSHQATIPMQFSSSYTVSAGTKLRATWPLSVFAGERYHLSVYGPNGFFREFVGDSADPRLRINCDYQVADATTKALTGNIVLLLACSTLSAGFMVEVSDNAYGAKAMVAHVGPTSPPRNQVAESITLDLVESSGWYDFSIRVQGFDGFTRRYAGHVDTGLPSISDPVMGMRRVSEIP